ncbi:hypothetical protein Fcan01_17310 [Folsomia candida]|uniref:Uncharacterized protein n=1 Tax=Folsomia candida TaxID=158441 RepID=A0A226DT26_FOLCA|nr:hypothetical protein Fcan01_17310 [Folsomia candida]
MSPPGPSEFEGAENGLYKRWSCDDLTSRQVWLTLDAVAGSAWFNITISNDTPWERGWEASILGTLYQTNYTLAGACPEGYFDCRSPSPMCLGQNRQHDTQRCIPDKVVCDKRPSCGMLCNPDEADICNRTATTQRSSTGKKNDFHFPTWAYYIIGGVALGLMALYFMAAWDRRRVQMQKARQLDKQPVHDPIPIPKPVEPSWTNAYPGGQGSSRRNSRDVSDTATVPVFARLKIMI